MNNGPAIVKRRLITVDDIDGVVSRLPKEHADDAKRQLRKPLLNALDVYDKNVSKGRVVESAEQKEVVDAWYRDICDLNTDAFKTTPDCVKKYKGA